MAKITVKSRGKTRRDVHARRIPDILMGSVINGTKRKARELAVRQKRVLADSRTKFNDVIRANSPTIYAVDPELIVKAVISGLTEKAGNNQYISGISTPEGLVSAENLQEFGTAFSQFQQDLIALEPKLVAAVTDELRKEFPSIETNRLLGIADDVYIKMIEALTKAESRSKKIYADFRAAAANAGASIRRELNAIGVSILKDPELILNNVQNRIIFVGFTFNTAVTNINSAIQKAVNSVLDSSSNAVINKSTFKIGNLVHAGHVGIYQDNNLLGINMPSGVIAGIATNKLEQIEQAIGQIPLHIEHGLRVTKDFSDIAGIFLDLQFNFAVSMQAAINSAQLGPLEQQAIRSVVGDVGEEALFEVLSSRVGAEAFAQIVDILPDASSSKTLLDFVEDSVANNIAFASNPSYKQKTGVFPGKTIASSTGIVLQNVGKKSTKSTVRPKVKPPTFKKTKQVRLGATNLLTILSLRLFEQIKKNMGTGGSREVLNYRTGRFARSAKVEHISQSREGMITIFYSYMKNPYATFSRGGRQELPRSRDPKLLISKSIREIVGEQVANRLRAVNV